MILKSSFSKVQNGKITVCIEDQNNYAKKNSMLQFFIAIFHFRAKIKHGRGH